MSIIDILNPLLITLNTNEDDKEETLYGVLDNFIRKMIYFFLIIVGKKNLQIFP